MIKVFISHPYSNAPFDNTTDSMKIYDELAELGFNPFNPLLFHWQQGFKARDYDWWIKVDLEWLACCDAVYMCDGHDESRGCRIEWEMANNLNKPIFYNIQDLVNFYKDK